MKIQWFLFVLLIGLVCMSMTQCPQCIKGRLKVDDNAKQWLPYRGKDSITFISSSGVISKMKCSYADVTNTYQNFECDDTYEADSVGFTLEIKPSDSLYLTCNMNSPSWLCFRTMNMDSAFISGCNVLNGPITEMRKSFTTYTLNNFRYSDVKLVNAYPGTNPDFDSLFFARNYGVVSFKYKNTWYYLKQ